MQRNFFLRGYLIAIILLMGVSHYVHAEELKSIVNRSTIAIDETLQLTVRYIGNSQKAAPSFTQLESQFDILSTRKNNQFHNINGKVTAFTDWTMMLSPRQEGTLVIPSFRYGSLISDAVEITVTPPQQAPNTGVKDVFVETIVGKTSVHVQEQILVKYRLYYAVNVDSLEDQPLEIENVIKEVLPETRYNRKINDRLYGIVEFSYALYPQTSGEIEIPSLVWDVNIPKAGRQRSFFGFSGRMEIARLRTDKHIIDVLPRPDTFPVNKPWLPANNLSLVEQWSKDPSEFKVGEPITRKIVLKAEGLTSSQLPQVWNHVDGEVKTYADQPELKDEKTAEGINAVRIESAAVVLSSGGQATLPAIRVPWWDVNSKKVQYAEIPERVIFAEGGAQQNSAAGAPALPLLGPSGQSSEVSADIGALESQLFIWKSISLGLFILFVSSLSAWWFSRRSSPELAPKENQNVSEISAFKSLKVACKSQSPTEIREALLKWGNIHWREQVKTIDDIVKRVNDPNITHQLRWLDQSLFSDKGDTKFNAEQLFALLKSYLKSRSEQHQEDSLQSFYAT